MAITDLTNTTWVFKDTPSYDGGKSWSYSVEFQSNNINYTSISYTFSDPLTAYMKYESTTAYDIGSMSWSNDAYKTIKITGGTDVTNTTLINWLQKNATLQETPTTDTKPVFKRINSEWVKQLAFERVNGEWVKISSKEEATPQLATPQNVTANGTTVSFDEVENATSYDILADGVSIGTVENESGETWVINENILYFSSGNYPINFISNGNNYTELNMITLSRYYQLKYNDTKVADFDSDEVLTTWTSQAYRTVTFETAPTGDLLTWLQANATKQ